MALNDNVRITVSDVKAIFNTNLQTGALETHINMAAAMVDDIVEAASEPIDDETLELIETYLAADIASSQDPRVSSSSVGDSSFDYVGPTKETQYWQIANRLDPTGTLGTDTVQVDVDVIDSR